MDEDENYISECHQREVGHHSQRGTNTERMQPNWKAPVYAFFKPDVTIEYVRNRCAVVFQCAAPGCEERVLRFTDKKDATSTSNLRTHVRQCKRWGEDILMEVSNIKGLDEARSMAESFTRTGTITKIFKRLGKGKLTFSTRQHRPYETR